MATTGLTLLTCSVLQAEVLALQQAHWPGAYLLPVNSMLHMRPDRLFPRLEALVRQELDRGQQVLLVYGDCCAQMSCLEAQAGVARTQGHNCYELLLGTAVYKAAEHAGVFFLLPEWARRWKQIFKRELGLNKNNAAALMQDMHTRLVYLDTGLLPVPHTQLQACATYVGLPLEIQLAPLDPLRRIIDQGLEQLS